MLKRLEKKISIRSTIDMLLILGFISLLTWIHYSSYHYSVDYHILLQFGYYIPVIYAAIRFGTLGGIGSGLLITVVCLPFLTNLNLAISSEAKFTQWVEILLINGFGWFTGFLVEQEYKATRRLERTLEDKEILVEKLKEEAQERHRLEAEVRQSERLSALGQLSTGLAHEIRNPLGIIRVTTQLLSEEKKEDQTIVEYSKVLKEETDRLNRLLTDFLEFARPKEPIRQRLNLGELVQEGLHSAKPLFEEAGIKIEVQISNILKEEPIEADRDKIKQVLLNLLLNALDAQKESDHPEGSILIEGISLKEWLGFAILDQGLGIPDSVLADIFNPFFTTKEKGTGLGLSIVYRIVEQHQGRITLTNRDQGGVRAEVILPKGSKTSA